MKNGFIKVGAATPKIVVADTEHNADAIISLMREANEKGVKILVFPELCITGYTCEDLVLQRTLLEAAEKALERIVKESTDLDMLVFVGLPIKTGTGIFNCAAVINRGEILGVIPKNNIPSYGEFYEKRYFISGDTIENWQELTICGQEVPFGTKILFECAQLPELRVGCEICEDLWVPHPPAVFAAMAGATLIVNLSASDEIASKDEYRRMLVTSQSARLVCSYIYACAGEGESTQDVVYTGHNMIYENGVCLAESNYTTGLIVSEIDVYKLSSERQRMGSYSDKSDEYLICVWDTELTETELTRHVPKNPFIPEDEAARDRRSKQILTVQSLGLKKRIEHTNISKLVIGVSGGLDSTLALAVAANALDMLGRPRSDIVSVTMPCFGTTKRTKSNAELLAEKLGTELRVIDISDTVMMHFKDIGHDFDNHNVVFENGQARERTQVLMDIANECGGLVVGTGDLSELALGWATYNGDHMSMYGVNSGVPKTMVRQLVKYYADTCGDDQLKEVLYGVLNTPVSPELLPAENGEISQKTEDLVGPYELHDFYMYYVVRYGYEPQKIYRLAVYAFRGEYDNATILKWLKTFYRRFFSQQFKRSCLPDGPKVGSISLSPRGDWRMPSDASARVWQKQLDEIEI